MSSRRDFLKSASGATMIPLFLVGDDGKAHQTTKVVPAPMPGDIIRAPVGALAITIDGTPYKVYLWAAD